MGENGGLIGLREQSPEWSLIINMSITGMRRLTGIKATIGSCRKQSWKRGRALLSHSSGQRHRPVLCSAGPSVGIVSNSFICCAAFRPPDLPVAASTSLLPHGRQELHGELLLHLYHTQHCGVWGLCGQEASKVGTPLRAPSKAGHPPHMSDWYPMRVIW